MKSDSKKILTICLGLLVYFGTFHLANSQNHNDKLITIGIDFDKSKPLKMSDLFSEIKYIPLETNSNCLIGNMNIPVFGKDIIIQSHDSEQNIFRFSNNGKFINKIGKLGPGPKEYHSPVNELRLIGDTVYAVDFISNQILCYSLTGNYLKKYKVNTKAHPKEIIQLPDQSFMISLNATDDFGNIIKTDKNFKILSGFKNSPLATHNSLPVNFRRINDKIFYCESFIDTIFDITNGTLNPFMSIDYGKYHTSNLYLSLNKQDNKVFNKPHIQAFYAGENYFLLTIFYPFQYKVHSVLYHITDGKLFMWSELVNDIDNGITGGHSGFLAGYEMIFTLMPLTILEKFEKMTDAEKQDPKNSGFVEMASKIKPESNPVIMVCKLKNDLL